MAKKPSNSRSLTKKSEKQEAFERDGRHELEHADMNAFDEMMRKVIKAPTHVSELHSHEAKKRQR